MRVLSPTLGPARSAIVTISHTDPNLNPAVYEKLRADGIDIALRWGNLRLSPHLHNSEQDVRQAVEAIARYA